MHRTQMAPRRAATTASLIAAACVAMGASAFAAPLQTAPLPPPIPAARNVAYPGTLKLAVDATDIDRHLTRVRETIPVAKAGPMVLSLPKWIPGEHAPSGPIAMLGGLVITANGQRIEWTRDTVEVTAFHINVPAGVTELQVDLLQQASPSASFPGAVVTPAIAVVKWGSQALYPAGYAVSGIKIEPSVKLPAGWKFASALDGATTNGDTTRFAPTSFETLVDSPLYAGRYMRSFDLDPGAAVPVRLNVFADNAASLDAKPEQIDAHKRLVQQAYKLFGAHHYDHYDFLFSLSEQIGSVGIEHHRSSEDGWDNDKYFTDWEHSFVGRDLLAHEYTHSWNGKFRRPADLWTPDYTTPMRDSMLWVYEGQTEYWGMVLAERAGLVTKQQSLDQWAQVAATLDARAGRSWRSLQDTTNGEILGARGMRGSASWMRSLDYYDEGALIWLDADTLIREGTQGKRSLDDFARTFFGIDNGSYVPVTYTFEQVVAALNSVYPHDWAGFLRTRLDSHGPGAPLDGLARGGYKLAFTDQASDFIKTAEMAGKWVMLVHSIGFNLDKDSRIDDVQWEGPAFKAGITNGAQLIAVGGVPYDADVLKAAIKEAAQPGAGPIELLVKADGRYRTVAVDYHGGLRYPKLERVEATPARLDDILAPKS